MTRRILVTGTEGQVVGSLVEKTAGRDDIELLLIGLPELDLTATDKIAPAIEALKPDVILSVAAYTAVDAAEGDEATALAVNGTAVGEIGKAAARLGVPVVHLSTDYVFSGDKPTPYVEIDPTGPLSAYGRTKLAGELALAAATPNHAILRTAWVYSPFGKNFVKTMLRLASERSEVSVVDDQIGCPTYAPHLADAILKIAPQVTAPGAVPAWGIYHAAGSGETTWCGFARAIFAEAAARGVKVPAVVPIRTEQYPTPARRPPNSRLDCSKLERNFGVRQPPWKVGLRDCLDALGVGKPAST